MCPDSLIFNRLVGQTFSEQVTFTDSHDGAVAVRAARNEHVIGAPGKIVDRCVVNVANHCDRRMLVRRVDDDLIRGRHGKHHPVRKVKKWSLPITLLFVIKVGVELDARCVRLESW